MRISSNGKKHLSLTLINSYIMHTRPFHAEMASGVAFKWWQSLHFLCLFLSVYPFSKGQQNETCFRPSMHKLVCFLSRICTTVHTGIQQPNQHNIYVLTIKRLISVMIFNAHLLTYGTMFILVVAVKFVATLIKKPSCLYAVCRRFAGLSDVIQKK